MKEALYYIPLEENKVQCHLCPWNCELLPDQTGICKVRYNERGKLYSLVYDKVAALGSDPIEKKPLYHFYPGKNILSIGEVGCNLHCSFCQNYKISQCYANEFRGFHNITPAKVVAEALKTWNNIGIAYTYNEPFTFYEFLSDIAKKASSEGLKNVVVSNGYINQKPLNELLPFVDAFNVDLKSFSADFYKRYTKGKLAPVLDTLKAISQSKAHLEITNLVIPDLNDDPEQFTEMVKWIANELGDDLPLHISRYFPQFKMKSAPTSLEKLNELFGIAKRFLQHVYLGNISDEQKASTFCSECGELLIIRNRYNTSLVNLSDTGQCKQCKAETNIVLK